LPIALTCKEIQKKLRSISDPDIAVHSSRFFKTGPGEYGEGDRFLGIGVPDIRKVARQYREMTLLEIKKLLHSKFHEERLCALIMLVTLFQKSEEIKRKKIYETYLKHTSYINNWDLVGVSAPAIIGGYLLDKERDILYKLVTSDNLWERRIAIMSTFQFIKNNEFGDTLNLAGLLIKDHHDLIHKAAGWMLREVGKRNLDLEEQFLRKHAQHMPRTMLRYAIEKFPESKRKRYLEM
jgi:3-methyladenine DNA glycosylase AlkD